MVVQRLVERATEPIKLRMVHVLAPHLARIGCHKNGTWAAQKVLDCIPSPSPNDLIKQEELMVAVESLAPYVPPLLLDQFGNYVVQGLLRFGPPYTDAIFAAFLEQTWEIAQGRFGARSMRSLLDHPNVSLGQKRLVALAVVLCAVPLACSTNGSLLLHWLLDDPDQLFSSGQRFRLVWQRLAPHLRELATHKLGSVVLVRLAHQTTEPEVVRYIAEALFEPSIETKERLYSQICLDPVHGTQVIAQVLRAPCLDKQVQNEYVTLVRTLVLERQLVQVPAHRMLVETVGLVPRPLQAGTWH